MLRRSPKRPLASDGGPVVLAHRGWRGRYPENTMLAFEKAAEMPIDGLETDIHSTADGVLVAIHDDTVNRTTDGSGQVQDFTLAELKKLDAGYRWTPDGGKTFPFRGQGITIPTLAELFEAFPHLWINVDVKQESPSIIAPFVELIHQYNLAQNICVGSFSDKNVAEFRRLMPDVARSGSPKEVRRLLALHKLRLGWLYWGAADAFQIPEEHGRLRIVTPRFIRDAQRQKTAVHVWTVNETADMQRLLDWGVDGLITDFPDRALKLLGRL